MNKRPTLAPGTLRDAPALIESVFPVQKVSFGAQQERTGVQSQTLTGLGSFWKGRKSSMLVRAIVLGPFLPATHRAKADLDVLQGLDEYIDAHREATGFDLRYTSTMAPPAKDWRDCTEVLSRRDFVMLITTAWTA